MVTVTAARSAARNILSHEVGGFGRAEDWRLLWQFSQFTPLVFRVSMVLGIDRNHLPPTVCHLNPQRQRCGSKPVETCRSPGLSQLFSHQVLLRVRHTAFNRFNPLPAERAAGRQKNPTPLVEFECESYPSELLTFSI